MSINERSVFFEDIKCVYDSYGTGGEALVFVHGWTCSSALWNAQTQHFKTRRCIVIDLPGHGRSDAPTNTEYSLEIFANSVNAIFEAENIDHVVLVGHSMGGPVSTMTLRLFPEKISGIIYVDSFFHLPEAYLTHAQRRELAARHADDTQFREFLGGFFTPKTTENMKAQITNTMVSTAKHVRCNATTTPMQPHAWRWGEVYDIPALHVVTPMFEERADGAWLRHLPKLETRLWRGYGHFLFMEDVERFNSEVEEWLQGKSLLQ